MSSTAAAIPTRAASASQGKAVAAVRIPDPSPGQGKQREKKRRRKRLLQRKKLAKDEEIGRDKETVQQEADGAGDDGGDRDEEMLEDGRVDEDDEKYGAQSESEGESHENRNQGNTKTKDVKENLTLKKGKKIKRKEVERGELVRITARENSEGGGGCGVWITHPSPPPSQSAPPDLLTWRTFLTSSLTRLFGIQGASCLVDILKLENWDCWVKVVGSDGNFGAGISSGGFGVAVGGYVCALAGDEAGSGRGVSVRVVKGGRWLVGVAGGGQSDLWVA
ncbi:hypothetical protein BGX38DRAFT_1279367 [Terfezia claveryi]|nr:hypothetical protein BGX38DRAFT_1279367 [Terfezia claveryi]